MTTLVTLREETATVFVAVDHARAEYFGIHAARMTTVSRPSNRPTKAYENTSAGMLRGRHGPVAPP